MADVRKVCGYQAVKLEVELPKSSSAVLFSINVITIPNLLDHDDSLLYNVFCFCMQRVINGIVVEFYTPFWIKYTNFMF